MTPHDRRPTAAGAAPLDAIQWDLGEDLAPTDAVPVALDSDLMEMRRRIDHARRAWDQVRHQKYRVRTPAASAEAQASAPRADAPSTWRPALTRRLGRSNRTGARPTPPAWREALEALEALEQPLRAVADGRPTVRWPDDLRIAAYQLVEALSWVAHRHQWHPDERHVTWDTLLQRGLRPDLMHHAPDPAWAAPHDLLSWPLEDLEAVWPPPMARQWEALTTRLAPHLMHSRADVRWWLLHAAAGGDWDHAVLTHLVHMHGTGPTEWAMVLDAEGAQAPTVRTTQHLLHALSSARPSARPPSATVAAPPARAETRTPPVVAHPDGPAWWLDRCARLVATTRSTYDQAPWWSATERLLPHWPAASRRALWGLLITHASDRVVRLLGQPQQATRLTADVMRDLLCAPHRAVREAALRALPDCAPPPAPAPSPGPPSSPPRDGYPHRSHSA